MKNVSKRYSIIKGFAVTFVICLILGFVPALLVSRETSGYVAGMSVGIIVLIFGLPLICILFVLSIIAAINQNPKYAAIFLSSCLLIPLMFGGSMKLLEVTGTAVYARKGVDDMRLLETDSTKGWTIVYKKGVSFEKREKFSNQTFFPFEKDRGFTHESGVSEAGYQKIKDYTASTVYFSNNVTQEQKDKLRGKLKESVLVYKFYENVNVEDIKDLP